MNKGRIHWAWIILGVCFADLFVNYSIRLGYSVVLPEMLRDLKLSRTDGGSIYNSYLFVYVALTPLTGFLTDRFGARRVITVCAVLLGGGVWLMGTARSLGAACLFYALAGLGATGMWTPVITVVQRWFASNRRGLALGIISTGYGLGLALLGVLFPVIVSHYSWRYAWYFLGLAALVLALGNGMLLRSAPEAAGWKPWGAKTDSRPAGSSVEHGIGSVTLAWVFRQKNFWVIGGSYFFISYALYGFTTFMVDYAESQLGLPMDQAARLATIHGLAQVVGVLTILPLSDWVGRKRTIIVSELFLVLSLAGILFLGQGRTPLYVFTGVFGAFYGVTFPIYGATAGDYFPKTVMGTVIGAWTPFYGLGAVSVHWVSGMLRDAAGNYTTAFVLNLIAAVVALTLILFVKHRDKDQ